MKTLLALFSAMSLLGFSGMTHADCGGCSAGDTAKKECPAGCEKECCTKKACPADCEKECCKKKGCSKSKCDKGACDKGKCASEKCPEGCKDGCKCASTKCPEGCKDGCKCTKEKGCDTGCKKSSCATGANQVKLNVTGMTCSGCSGKLKQALDEVDGIKVDKVCHKSGCVVVTLDPEKASKESVSKTIKANGFKIAE